MPRTSEPLLEQPPRPRVVALSLDSGEEFLRSGPALTHLRAEFPNGHLTLVCRPEALAAARELGIADQIRPYVFDQEQSGPTSGQTIEEAPALRDACRGEFDIAVDLTLDTVTRPILRQINAILRCGIGSRREFPFLHVAVPQVISAQATPPVVADHICFGPTEFQSRMPTQTPFFHETDFSVSNTHLIYGPYARLPVGLLRATFTFELRAPRYSPAYGLELVVEVAGDHGTKIISSHRVVNLVRGRLTSISLEFTNRDPGRRFEFRVFVGGRPRWTTLRFYGVRVERLQPAITNMENPHSGERLRRLVSLVALRTRELSSFVRAPRQPQTNGAPQTCALPLYTVARRFADPVPAPPATGSPARISVVVLDCTGSVKTTGTALLRLAEQTVAPCETFLLTHTNRRVTLDPHATIVTRLAPGEAWTDGVNRVAERATGTHLVILAGDTMLHPKALAWFSFAIENGHPEVIYSDAEAVLPEPHGAEETEPIFRSAFDYELLLQRNYIGSPFCIARSAYLALGGISEDQSLDPWHDLLLRAVEMLGRSAFRHLPAVLAASPIETTATDLSLGRTIRAVQSHLNRTRSGARAVAHADACARNLPDSAAILWPVDGTERISVIVPTRDSVDLVFSLVSSLRRHARSWERVEVIVVVNGASGDRTRLGFAELESVLENVRIVFRAVPFNWCEINNNAARSARGDILLFLNDDMVCLTPSWDARLASQLGRRQIGLVGARLLYPDGSLQHAGIAIGGDGSTAHEAMGDPADDGLYRDRTLLAHGAGLLTGAFLACRRSLFEELGGFDAQRYAVTSGDADFCMRVRATGRSVIYDPALTWIHYESVSRGYDQDDHRKRLRADAEHELWRSRFGKRDLVDLSGNPHLDRGICPFDSFHYLQPEEITLWLHAQISRAEGWASFDKTSAEGQAQSDRTAVETGEFSQ